MVSLNIVDELVQAAGKAKSSHAKPIFIDPDPQEERDRRSVTTDICFADVVKAWKHLSLTIIDELVQTAGKAKSLHAKPIFILMKNKIEGQSIQM